MTLYAVALGVVAITLLSGHVAPSVDDNNRYLKLTPLRGGFRLAYTVFFGQIPGASERRHLDTNRDGRIAPAEAKTFGDRLGAQVADALELVAGGAAQRVAWTAVDVGLGTDAVSAGAFSVDMIGYFCVPGAPHRIGLRDRFRIPRPGETEVTIEDSPGVTIAHARIGALDDTAHAYKFVGPGGPLADDGLDVEWSAAASAPAVPEAACATTAASPTGRPWLIPAIAAGGLAALAAAVVLALRARRRAKPV